MKKLLQILILLTLSLIINQNSYASSKRTVPYFASIKVDEANIRTGPSVKYPIRWVYKRENWPVQVIATFEGWRKIADLYGEAGWIHKTLLSPKRRVYINSNGVEELYRLPISTSSVVLILESGVIADLVSCDNNWCQISIGEQKGWIKSNKIWGSD